MTTKAYVSPSQLGMYFRCGEQYRRRYIEGERLPPGIAMLKGTGVHRGAQRNMEQKVQSRVDLPTSEIVELAVIAFETETQSSEISFTEDELSRGTAAIVGEATDAVADMAAVHAKEQAPDYQPTLVEQTVRIQLPGNQDLLGIVDLADDQHRVIDFKTAKKRKSQGDADSSVQLTTYSIAYYAQTGRPPAELRLDALVALKTKISRQVVATTRDAGDYRALAHRINVFTDYVHRGVFPPASPGAWWCSPNWCGYWRTCRYVNSERKARAKE